MAPAHPSNSAVCQCGETVIELTGAPILSLTCYCESCRAAGRGFEQAPGAPRAVTAAGGVDYCLYRKDRVRLARGAGRLREHRLKSDSPTRRVVASCCGAPMFLEFTPGHWLSIFRDRLPAPAPELEMGVMTKDRPEGSPPPPGAVPAYAARPPRFMVKLLGAWAAMGFRRPKVAW